MGKPLYNGHGSDTVVDMGGMDLDGHQKSLCVNDNMLLPSLCLLVAVNAPVLIRMMGCLHASGVDDAQAWAFFQSHGRAKQLPQGVRNNHKDIFVFPLAVIVINGVVCREILWQHTPLASSLVQVQNRIKHGFQRILPFSVCGINYFPKYLSLIFGKNSWIFTFHN